MLGPAGEFTLDTGGLKFGLQGLDYSPDIAFTVQPLLIQQLGDLLVR